MKKTNPNTLMGDSLGRPFKFVMDGVAEHTMILAPSGTGMSFNPMAAVVDDEGRNWLIDFFAKMANVTLAAESRAGYLGVIKSLPPGASLADFISAARRYEAAALGLSVETYEAVSPFLLALAEAEQKVVGIDVPNLYN